ncbi:hypothetical protein ACW4TU_35595 [Streptomyces sp. QTS52]
MLEVLDRAADDGCGGRAGGPVQGEVDEFAVTADADGDLVEDGSDDFLAVGMGDPGCLRETGQVHGGLPDSFPFLAGEVLGCLALEAAPLLLDIALGDR